MNYQSKGKVLTCFEKISIENNGQQNNQQNGQSMAFTQYGFIAFIFDLENNFELLNKSNFYEDS